MKSLLLSISILGMASISLGAGLKARCERTLGGLVPVTLDWDRVNEGNDFVKKLVSDPDFLKLPFDLSQHAPKLSNEDLKRLLSVPMIRDNPGLFARDVLIGHSFIYINPAPESIEPFLEDLTTMMAKKGDYADFRDSILKYYTPRNGDDAEEYAASRSRFKDLFDSVAAHQGAPEFDRLKDFFAKADWVDAIHTTRGMSPKPGPDNFGAGRFGVTIRQGNQARYFVMQTEEGKVSHINPVTPGIDKIDGSIQEATDNGFKSQSGTELSKAQERELLASLLRNWGSPYELSLNQKDKVQENKRDVINFVAAIYSNGDMAKLKKAYQDAGKLALFQKPVPKPVEEPKPEVGLHFQPGMR